MNAIRSLIVTLLFAGMFAASSLGGEKKEEALFVASPLTVPGAFTPGIEGPACDAAGNVYAVNFGKEGTIGRVTPDGKAEVYAELPEGSVGNGIRFDRKGVMFIADYTKHNVLRIDPKTRKVAVFAHEVAMNQPNDLAIGPDGTLYASDPAWSKGTGQLWRIGRDARVTLLAGGMGTTNGIEVSPDGKSLYVNESVQRNVWAFSITKSGKLENKRLIKQFPDFGFDGMRCDIDGNLYITRHGKGTVVKMTPAGEILREVDVLGTKPSNLCFGGPDGRTVYVTEVDHTRLVTFRADRPGLAWQRWQEAGKIEVPVDDKQPGADLSWLPVPRDQIRTYTAYRAAGKITIDGKLDEAAWKLAPRSPKFVDIITGKGTEYSTRAAVLWNDDFLYVGFEIEEPDVQARLKERDAPIYSENDVEVFIAGAGGYYELEINALGTLYEAFFVWKNAYESGGFAADPSFRREGEGVIDFNGVGFKTHPRGKRTGFMSWDFPGLRSAVHVDGTLNDDSDKDQGWSVEFAFPWKSAGMRALARADQRAVPPKNGDTWRMDFSRFNKKKHGDGDSGGWVWSRHGVWDSHLPECFVRITFSEKAPKK